MDRHEENALHEVDRIAVAVEHLRDLLLAATEAELRAQGKATGGRTAGNDGRRDVTH